MGLLKKPVFIWCLFVVDFKVVLEDEATVAAYKPLTPIHPSSASALLAIGSTYHVVW
jgi:hypothetical protein